MYQSASLGTLSRIAESLGLDIPDYVVMSSDMDGQLIGLFRKFSNQ